MIPIKPRAGSQLFALFLLSLFISACASVPETTPHGSVQVDNTFGRYDEDLEKDLILITMQPAFHRYLTEAQNGESDNSLPGRYQHYINRLTERYDIHRVADWPLATIDIFCIIFENKSSQSRDSIISRLLREEGIQTAQAVNSFATQATAGPPYNDPYLSLQHGLVSMQALNSHTLSRGEGVRVAVIDTGTDINHPDLIASAELSRNFVDKDERGFVNDVHGTAVSGIIAAAAGNEQGIVGVAPESSILAIKACWQISPDGSSAKCNTLTLAKALNFSITEGVDIINMSLTGPPDPLLETLVREALRRDIIVIGALPEHRNAAFPVSVPGTISVSDSAQIRQAIRAPGNKVISTLPGEKYGFFNGSSFATAHVSGLAAVIRSVSPDIKPLDLFDVLYHTVNSSTGTVNACLAVSTVLATSDRQTVCASETNGAIN